MTSILLTLRIALLASFLFTLLASPSFSITATGKNHSTKRPDARRTLPPKPGTKDQALRKKNISSRETRLDDRRQVSGVKLRHDDRPARLPKGQLRLAQKRLEAERRAQAERIAYLRSIAIARERARDEELRSQVQSMIAKDDLAGEDPEVRRAAVNALGNHAGTVVVMNPQTGRIYSMVNQQWALREGFKPCSTIKLVTGLAGLNESVIDLSDTTKISDDNQLSLTRALAYSKNEYFQQVGGLVGFDKMISYARQLGLGEKTGVNARNEYEGSVPPSAARSGVNHMSSHGDNFEVTPIQLATLVSAIANGGKLLTPHIARTKQEEFNFKTKVRRQVKMDVETWKHMVPGMVGAVSYGSGRRAYDPGQTIAGKTGTCIEQGTWVGLFTSYAPLANPRLAVVVIARGADAHAHFPAAVAGKIYRDLSGRFGTPENLQIATTRKSYTPAIRAETSLEDEEENEATAVTRDWNDANNIGGINRGRSAQAPVKTSNVSDRATVDARPLMRKTAVEVDSKVRPVLMQIPSRNQNIVRPTGGSNVTPSKSLERETRPRRVSEL
ncbi:MAG: penicillin-binding transpeptidase domain-containing protein [bacterium]